MIKNLKPKSEFSKNVLTLMTGTTIAQAIPIAISPILTRIYSPEDFGVFVLYTAIVSLVTAISTGKYELAIMLPSEKSDAFNIVIFSVLLSIFVSFISFIVIFIFNDKITNLLGNQEISNWLYFIPISIILSSIYQSLNYWNNRNKYYKLMSKTTIVQASSNGTFNISLGMNQYGFSGLILTNILTGLISIIFVLFNSAKYVFLLKTINKDRMINLIKQYKQFPLHTLPQNLIYQATLQLPIILFKAIFSLSVLGFYSLAYRVIVTPLSVVGNSLGQVYYQKASFLFNTDKEELFLYTRKLFLKLLLFSFLIALLLFNFLPDLFSIIFGHNWKNAGIIAQYLLIYLVYDFALTPFTKLYLVTNNNIFYLKWEIVRFLVIGSFLYFFYVSKIGNLDLVFFIFSVLNLVFYIFLSIPILRKNSFLWRYVTK